MRKALTSFLIVSAIFLSACRGTIPPAPIVQRCIIDLTSGSEICYDYKIDVIGGVTDEATEVRRQISDRSVCFPIEEWMKISIWRDEVIEWAEDNRRDN